MRQPIISNAYFLQNTVRMTCVTYHTVQKNQHAGDSVHGPEGFRGTVIQMQIMFNVSKNVTQ